MPIVDCPHETVSANLVDGKWGNGIIGIAGDKALMPKYRFISVEEAGEASELKTHCGLFG